MIGMQVLNFYAIY